jgi:hypothetical protein
MAIKEEYHNVSVRLKDQDYQKLLFLHQKFDSMSYGKVTLADVLRISVNETWLRESQEPNKPVSDINRRNSIKEEPAKQLTVEDVENAIAENPQMITKLAEIIKGNETNETPKEKFINELEAVQAVTEEETEEETNETSHLPVEAEEELKQYEIKWRNSTNKKNKPYSEQYIQNQLKQKRKELTNKYQKKIEE